MRLAQQKSGKIPGFDGGVGDARKAAQTVLDAPGQAVGVAVRIAPDVGPKLAVSAPRSRAMKWGGRAGNARCGEIRGNEALVALLVDQDQFPQLRQRPGVALGCNPSLRPRPIGATAGGCW